jgi:hypothetical protein
MHNFSGSFQMKITQVRSANLRVNWMVHVSRMTPYTKSVIRVATEVTDGC